MKNKLDQNEIALLLSADHLGQIIIPCGSAEEIEGCFNALLKLQKNGLVTRDEGKAFYRPFTLTSDGRAAVWEYSSTRAVGT